MKKIAVLLLASVLAGGFVAAQNARPGMGNPDQTRGPIQTVTVEGKLVFLNGFIAISTSAKTWIIHMPGYIYGFVDGLKEGAQVKLEGKERPVAVPQPTSHLFVTKLIFNGKEYDLSKAEHFGSMMLREFHARQGMMSEQRGQNRPPMMEENE